MGSVSGHDRLDPGRVGEICLTHAQKTSTVRLNLIADLSNKVGSDYFGRSRLLYMSTHTTIAQQRVSTLIIRERAIRDS